MYVLNHHVRLWTFIISCVNHISHGNDSRHPSSKDAPPSGYSSFKASAVLMVPSWLNCKWKLRTMPHGKTKNKRFCKCAIANRCRARSLKCAAARRSTAPMSSPTLRGAALKSELGLPNFSSKAWCMGSSQQSLPVSERA